jgi:hypothetical protein
MVEVRESAISRAQGIAIVWRALCQHGSVIERSTIPYEYSNPESSHYSYLSLVIPKPNNCSVIFEQASTLSTPLQVDS